MNQFLASLKPPSLFIFFSLILGILSGSCYTGTKIVEQLIFFGLSSLLIIISCVYKRFIFILFLFAVFCFGYDSIQYKLNPVLPEDHISRYMEKKHSIIKGEIVSFAQHYEKSIKVMVDCKTISTPDQEEKNVTGKIDLSIYFSSGPIPQFGDVVQFECTLHLPRNFGNPGAFDSVRQFKLKGLSARAYCDQSKIKILNEKESLDISTALLRAIEKFRLDFTRFVSDHTGNSESGRAFASLITGKSELITPDLRELFSKSGISHLFAISGLHLTIIGLLFYASIYFALSLSPMQLITGNAKKIAGSLTLIPMLLYSVFSGLSPSVIRSLIMAVVLLLAFVLEKEKDALSSLSLAGILILISDTAALFSISFQLSFLAVGFILCGMPLINRIVLTCNHPVLRKTVLAFFVSFFASLGTIPLTAYYFNIVSTAQLVSNLFLIPLIGVFVLSLGTICLFIFLIWPLVSIWIIYLCDRLISVSIVLCEQIIRIPYSWLRVMSLDGFDVASIYLICICIYFMLTGKKRLSALATALVFAAGAIHIFQDLPVKNPEEKLQITVLDVGQGSSSLIQTPQGYTILIDGGGFSDTSTFDTGKYILAPFLWRKKIHTLDYVILTHPESDHMNGLVYIFSNFKVHTLIKNKNVSGSEAYQKIIDLCNQKRVRIWNPSSQDQIMYLGETRFLFSACDDDLFTDDLNNASLVFKISYKDFSMLFPGDILSAREKRMVKSNPFDLKSNILLAPHHGSASSNSQGFLDKVNPGNVIVSCGRDNRYKFPNSKILNRYGEKGIRVFRTDMNGAIFISSNGGEPSITSHIDG